MARKPTKKEAKKKLDKIPDLPGFLTRLPRAPGLAARIAGAAKPLAELLIDVDPLGRTAEAPKPIQKEVKHVERNEVVKRMVNDPEIKIEDCKHMEFGNPSSHTYGAVFCWINCVYLLQRHYIYRYNIKNPL